MNLIYEINSFVKSGNSTNLPEDFKDPEIYDIISDTIDSLLENSDILLDEFEGKSLSLISKNINISLNLDKDRIFLSNHLNIQKPQILFLHEIDNSRENPFYPKIRMKPHALAPLHIKEEVYSNDQEVEDMEEYGEPVRPRFYFPHPYHTELSRLKYSSYQLYKLLTLF